jgi:RNA polymerase sigma-70 factor (ECF subfamily)
MSQPVSDGDLVRLARDGDAVAFRLLVERHLPMARARARRLCANPSDVDDIVQESFLQAFLALDRLRDPDRFPGWLAGIVLNACRALRRVPPVALLPDWPEPLHPAAADGQPSAEDLDRADALRAAVASLPAGQRHAVALHYYADRPAGQAGGSPGAARVSLHKARLRLRDYLTEHRPDLVSARRTPMTAVRVVRVERRIPPGPIPDRSPTHVIVLADTVPAEDGGRRELPLWLLGHDGVRISAIFQRRNPEDGNAGTIRDAGAKASTAEELTRRLLQAAGARVASVDIDELGPGVPVTRIGLTGPAGSGNVTARLPDGLAIAITAGTPIRVADVVMERLAVPASPGSAPDSEPGTAPGPAAGASEQTASVLSSLRPRYEPRNMAFAAGLSGWLLDGSFREHSVPGRWEDYVASADNETAVLQAATPDPAGFAFLAQFIWADDYRGNDVTFRGRLRQDGHAGRAGLFVRVETPGSGPGPNNPLNLDDVLADGRTTISTAAATPDWVQHEVTAHVPGDCRIVMFGIFLAGSGRIELREPELNTEVHPG